MIYDYDHPAAVEATAAMPALFVALTEAGSLPVGDPCRIAALAAQRRVLALVADAEVSP